ISIYRGQTKLATSSEFNFSPKTYGESNVINIKTPQYTKNYIGNMRVKYQNGKIRLTNTLKLEDYLKGVVPREMSASWHVQALKTQAVAARTYVIKNYHSNFSDTTSDQVYEGY